MLDGTLTTSTTKLFHFRNPTLLITMAPTRDKWGLLPRKEFLAEQVRTANAHDVAIIEPEDRTASSAYRISSNLQRNQFNFHVDRCLAESVSYLGLTSQTKPISFTTDARFANACFTKN